MRAPTLLPRFAFFTLPIFALLVGCSGASSTAFGDEPDSATVDDAATGDDAATADDSASASDDGGATVDAAPSQSIRTVFVIVMENHSWSTIKGNKSAPYINSLLAVGAHAENYKTPPGNHPSEPNYIWLEAGSNLGITNDNDPSSNHQSTKDHFVSQLEAKGLTWKSYQESIDGSTCPLTSAGLYGAKHNPMVFFDDVRQDTARCLAHVRPYGELATDLASGSVARYNFITPNLCDDMHGETFGTTCPSVTTDLIKKGDTWLSTEVPKILASDAYKSGGALFITWDEGDESVNPLADASDGPMGMIVLSPFAKKGYSNTIAYTHSSTLRTFEAIFGLTYLRDAANATDLRDLFTSFP